MKRILLFVALLITITVRAQFNQGNLVVLRYGNGTENILDASVKAGISLWIDQYNPASGSNLVNSLALPTNGANALILNGQTFNTEGMINRSADRTTVSVMAYNAALGSYQATLSGATAAQAPRVVATLDASQRLRINSLGTNYSLLGVRGAVCDDGTNNCWTMGSGNGLLYFDFPVYGTTENIVELSVAAGRNIRIFNGNLYYSVEPGSAQAPITAGIYYFQGLPTGVGFTNIFIATGQSSDPADFYIDPSGTICYVADSSAGILRFTNNAGLWYQGATIAIPSLDHSTNVGAFGLAADFSGTNAIIYATTVEGTNGNFNGNRIVRVVDSNAAPSVVTLATAGALQAFRGVDFAPDLRPLITGQPQSQNVSSGSSVTFQVTATSAYAFGYQWQLNGVNIANANAASYSPGTVTLAQSGGNYRVIVTNAYGSVTSAVAVLTVSTVKPTVVTQPASQTNFLGAPVAFNVAVSGTTPFTFQWSLIRNGATNALSTSGEFSITNGTTNSVLTINPVSTNDVGGYQVIIANSVGSATSVVAQLTVVAAPPGVGAQPASTTALVGGSASFSVSGTGTDTPDNPLVYQWYYVTNHLTNLLSDNNEFSGTASTTLNINPIQTADAGSYFVRITNSAGATNSQLATLAVIVPPAPSYVAYATAGATYSQSFDSLPNPGNASVNAANPVVINGVTYSLANPYDFAFPVLASGFVGGLGLSNTMPGWYGYGTVASKFGATAGDQTTGGQISFGKTNSSNRALGLIGTGTTGVTSYGLRLVNQTGNTLDHISLSYVAELWRQTGGAKSIGFSYYIDGSGTNTFVPGNVTATVTNLNVAFTAATPVTNLDGTLAANQKAVSVSNLAITNWAPGTVLWLTWQLSSAGSGGQGLGIDNLTFSASQGILIASPALAIKAVGTNVLVSWTTNATGFRLYQNTNLAARTAWSLTTQTPVVSGTSNVVTVPASGSGLFFRLSNQ